MARGGGGRGGGRGGSGETAEQFLISLARRTRPAAPRNRWRLLMGAESRRKLEMATRALEFSRAHPFSDASEAGMIAKLEERIARADGSSNNSARGWMQCMPLRTAGRSCGGGYS